MLVGTLYRTITIEMGKVQSSTIIEYRKGIWWARIIPPSQSCDIFYGVKNGYVFLAGKSSNRTSCGPG